MVARFSSAMLFGSLAAAATTDAEDALASITALVTHDVAAAVVAARAATSSFESAYPSADAARRLSSSFGGYIGEEHWTSKENCDGDPYRIDYTRPFFDASGDCDGPYAVDGQTFSAAGTCTSESEFEGKTYLGADCEGYVVDQWSGDYTGMCAPNVDGDFSYSYSFSYNGLVHARRPHGRLGPARDAVDVGPRRVHGLEGLLVVDRGQVVEQRDRLVRIHGHEHVARVGVDGVALVAPAQGRQERRLVELVHFCEVVDVAVVGRVPAGGFGLVQRLVLALGGGHLHRALLPGVDGGELPDLGLRRHPDLVRVGHGGLRRLREQPAADREGSPRVCFMFQVQRR